MRIPTHTPQKFISSHLSKIAARRAAHLHLHNGFQTLKDLERWREVGLSICGYAHNIKVTKEMNDVILSQCQVEAIFFTQVKHANEVHHKLIFILNLLD